MKFKNSQYSINLVKNFIKYQVHSGCDKSKLHYDFFCYLYGIHKNISIINLIYTLKSFKKLSFYVLYLLKTKKKIVFVGFPSWLQVLTVVSKNSYIFVNYRWGDNFFIKRSKSIGLVLVCQDFINLKELKYELNRINLPLMCFTFLSVKNFDFFTIGNFKTDESILFLFYYFSNLYFNSQFKKVSLIPKKNDKI